MSSLWVMVTPQTCGHVAECRQHQCPSVGAILGWTSSKAAFGLFRARTARVDQSDCLKHRSSGDKFNFVDKRLVVVIRA
jgi:hypothetical protein